MDEEKTALASGKDTLGRKKSIYEGYQIMRNRAYTRLVRPE